MQGKLRGRIVWPASITRLCVVLAEKRQLAPTPMCQNHYANKEVGSRDLLLPVLELAAWRAFRVNGGVGVVVCVTQNPDYLVPVLGLAQVASDRNPAGTNWSKIIIHYR